MGFRLRFSCVALSSGFLLAACDKGDDSGDNFNSTFPPPMEGGSGAETGGAADDSGIDGDSGEGDGSGGGNPNTTSQDSSADDDGAPNGETSGEGGAMDDAGPMDSDESMGGDEGPEDEGGPMDEEGGNPDEEMFPECARGEAAWPPFVNESSLAPLFETTDYAGERFRLCELSGTPMLIDIFAGWCQPCHDKAYSLQEAPPGSGWDLIRKAIDEGRLEYVQLMVDGFEHSQWATQADLMRFRDLYTLPFTHLVSDNAGEFWRYAGRPGFPRQVFVKSDYHYGGGADVQAVLDGG